jgi:hypothetical protein
MKKQADLIAYLFEGASRHLGDTDPFSSTLLSWIETSPRFTAFVDIYRDKIRKKIRNTRDLDGLLDLRAELEAAFRLLFDRRLALAYEPYASAKIRGSDDFSKDFLRLSAILIAMPGEPVKRWGNKAARPVLDEKVLRVISLALQAG